MRVLFVCMGNICRSPTAAGVFRFAVERAGLSDRVDVESAGTHAYHVGGGADRRAMKAAAARGVDLGDHVARAVEPDDFLSFDYILAMDRDNHAHLLAVAPKERRAKVELFLKYAPRVGVEEVPDPYYGGRDGFDRVLDLVTAASEGFLVHVREAIENPRARNR
jgi:protein-tyrosine phosphatase